MSQSIAQIRLFANEAVAINISSLRIEQSDLRVLICKLTCPRRLGCFLLLCRAAFRFQAAPVRLKLCNRQVKSVATRSPICSVYSRCCLLTGVSCGCGRGPVVRHLFFSHRKTGRMNHPTATAAAALHSSYLRFTFPLPPNG